MKFLFAMCGQCTFGLLKAHVAQFFVLVRKYLHTVLFCNCTHSCIISSSLQFACIASLLLALYFLWQLFLIGVQLGLNCIHFFKTLPALGFWQYIILVSCIAFLCIFSYFGTTDKKGPMDHSFQTLCPDRVSCSN